MVESEELQLDIHLYIHVCIYINMHNYIYVCIKKLTDFEHVASIEVDSLEKKYTTAAEVQVHP